MKKNIYFLIALALLFTSCSKKDEPNEDPLMSDIRVNGVSYPNNGQGHYLAGQVLNIEIDATDDRGLVSCGLDVQYSHYTIGKRDSTLAKVNVSGTKATAKFTYTIPANLGSDMTIWLSFSITDNENKVTGYSFQPMIDPDTIPYSIERTNGRVYNFYSTNITNIAWDIKNDIAVKYPDPFPSDQQLDYVYNFFNKTPANNGFEANLLAANHLDALRKVANTFDYANASEATAKIAFDVAPSNQPTNLVVGDIVVGRYLAINRYIVMKITNINVTAATDFDDYIEFKYKKDLQ